jgi:hypothetical protein
MILELPLNKRKGSTGLAADDCNTEFQPGQEFLFSQINDLENDYIRMMIR